MCMFKNFTRPLTTRPNNFEVLFSSQQIQEKVIELGEGISKYYRKQKEPLVLIGVLKGSFIFMSDLCRHIDVNHSCDFLGLSSYGDETVSSGIVKITSDLSDTIKGKNILVVEDILDTGLTMKYLIKNLKTRQPNSIRLCCLLKKVINQASDINIDYLGFTIQDVFVIGYGLDYQGEYRNIPYIGYVTK